MIHKYKLHGYNVVLDVNSGGVHLVDDLTYDMLDNVAPPFSDVCPAGSCRKCCLLFIRKPTFFPAMMKY